MRNIDVLSWIGGGASADVLRIGKGLVLKLFHPNIDPGIVQREIDGATRASAEGLLVPRPVGSRIMDGRHGVIFEELDGDPLLGKHDNWRLGRARAALRKLAICHARIHQGSGDGLIHHQNIILQVRIENSDVDQALRKRALDRLFALPRGTSLCHGDFHPSNAIQTAEGVAAIDWSNGCAGEPAGDVARTELLLRYGMYGPLTRRFPVLRWVRHLAADFYLKEYSRVSGMALEQIAPWRLPVAVACLVPDSRISRTALLSRLTHYN